MVTLGLIETARHNINPERLCLIKYELEVNINISIGNCDLYKKN